MMPNLGRSGSKRPLNKTSPTLTSPPEKKSSKNVSRVSQPAQTSCTASTLSASADLPAQSPQPAQSAQPEQLALPGPPVPPALLSLVAQPLLPASDVYTVQLLTALADPRVMAALHAIMMEPLMEQLAEKEGRIACLERTVSDLREDLSETREALDVMHNSLDTHEQYSRRNSLRFFTKQPEDRQESTDSLVIDMANSIGVSLVPGDICRSHRVGRPSSNGPRPIIAKFTSYRVRSAVFLARKKGRGLFITEDLTKSRSNMFFKARRYRTDGIFKHAWTNDGNVKVRFHDDRSFTVNNDEQLMRAVDIARAKAAAGTPAINIPSPKSDAASASSRSSE